MTSTRQPSNFDERLDEQLDDSFPASDPPAVTRRAAADIARSPRASQPTGTAVPIVLGSALLALLTVWWTRKR